MYCKNKEVLKNYTNVIFTNTNGLKLRILGFESALNKGISANKLYMILKSTLSCIQRKHEHPTPRVYPCMLLLSVVSFGLATATVSDGRATTSLTSKGDSNGTLSTNELANAPPVQFKHPYSLSFLDTLTLPVKPLCQTQTLNTPPVLKPPSTKNNLLYNSTSLQKRDSPHSSSIGSSDKSKKPAKRLKKAETTVTTTTKQTTATSPNLEASNVLLPATPHFAQLGSFATVSSPPTGHYQSPSLYNSLEYSLNMSSAPSYCAQSPTLPPLELQSKMDPVNAMYETITQLNHTFQVDLQLCKFSKAYKQVVLQAVELGHDSVLSHIRSHGTLILAKNSEECWKSWIDVMMCSPQTIQYVGDVIMEHVLTISPEMLNYIVSISLMYMVHLSSSFQLILLHALYTFDDSNLHKLLCTLDTSPISYIDIAINATLFLKKNNNFGLVIKLLQSSLSVSGKHSSDILRVLCEWAVESRSIDMVFAIINSYDNESRHDVVTMLVCLSFQTLWLVPLERLVVDIQDKQLQKRLLDALAIACVINEWKEGRDAVIVAANIFKVSLNALPFRLAQQFRPRSLPTSAYEGHIKSAWLHVPVEVATPIPREYMLAIDADDSASLLEYNNTESLDTEPFKRLLLICIARLAFQCLSKLIIIFSQRHANLVIEILPLAIKTSLGLYKRKTFRTDEAMQPMPFGWYFEILKNTQRSQFYNKIFATAIAEALTECPSALELLTNLSRSDKQLQSMLLHECGTKSTNEQKSIPGFYTMCETVKQSTKSPKQPSMEQGIIVIE